MNQPPAASHHSSAGPETRVAAVWVETTVTTGPPAMRRRDLVAARDGNFEIVAPARPPDRPELYVTNAPGLLRGLLAEAHTPSAEVLDFADLAELGDLRRPLPVNEATGDAAAPIDSGADEFARACADGLQHLRNTPPAYRSAMETLFESFAERRAQARLFGLLAGFDADPDRAEPFASLFPVGPSPREAKRRETPPAEISPIDPATLADMLRRDGHFSRLLPGYEPRQEQIEMLLAVADALNTGRHLMVEAGTGVGKSLAYLVPLAAWARANQVPVVVSTYTRNLQSQLLDKDVPLLTAAFGTPELRVALIKGRSNYLCLRRLLFLLDPAGGEIDPEEADLLAAVAAWAIGSDSGDLEELVSRHPEAAALIPRLTSNAEECAGAACRGFRQCLLQRARCRALQADMVVANHALVLSELDHDPIALPPHQQIVFDEAHNLEDAATNYFSVTISDGRLRRILRRLWSGARRRPRGLLATLDRQARRQGFGPSTAPAILEDSHAARMEISSLRAESKTVFQRLRDLPGVRPGEARRYRSADLAVPPWPALAAEFTALAQSLESLSRTLETLCDRLDEAASEDLLSWSDMGRDLRAAVAALRAFQAEGAFLLAADSEAHVFWILVSVAPEEGGELVAAPLEVGDQLYRMVYQARRTAICCSATLSVNQSFTFVSSRLGLDRVAAERMAAFQADSPFDYTRQVRIQAPMFLPEPRETGEYEDALSAFLLEVVRRTGGRTLVLFTSYAMLRTCASALARPLAAQDIRLLVQGQGFSRDAITREFRRGGRCVLFGTHSFWEGVDVAGDALSCVILARLPFPAVGDPLVEARCEKIERDGGDSFRGYMLPLAVIRFRQGFGRLIRHRDDRGIVIVADRRLLTKSYGVWFRRGLPCPISRYLQSADMLADVAAFLPPTPTQTERTMNDAK